MTTLADTLRDTAAHLSPHRDALAELLIGALGKVDPGRDQETRALCLRSLDALLRRLSCGEVEDLLRDDRREAAQAAREGGSLQSVALGIRVLNRCCLPYLMAAFPDRESLAESLLALDELADRRLEALLHAQEEEAARRLIEAQDQAARAADKARELERANEALRRSEAQSQHRADQIALLASVAHRMAPILEPERLMQEAAETIQSRMNHTYVAVVVLDDEGVLIGRWAGRPGIGRRSAGRTQGPAGGIIGRALRRRAPQVVADVTADPDYHADVPGTCSEMVVPLLEAGFALGAIDFQSEKPGAFDLDDVAAGEAIGEFLLVALRNARLFAEARRAAS